MPEAWTWRKKTKGKVDKTKGKVDKIFEVRLAKLSDGSKVLTGLGGRQSERSGGLFHHLIFTKCGPLQNAKCRPPRKSPPQIFSAIWAGFYLRT